MNRSITENRRKHNRHSLAFFMMAMEAKSQEVLGQLMDITSEGLLIDSPRPLEPGQDYLLQLEAMYDRSEESMICFTARTKWCRPDAIDPFLYGVGFEITHIAPDDAEALQKVTETYTVRDDLPLSEL